MTRIYAMLGYILVVQLIMEPIAIPHSCPHQFLHFPKRDLIRLLVKTDFKDRFGIVDKLF